MTTSASSLQFGLNENESALESGGVKTIQHKVTYEKVVNRNRVVNSSGASLECENLPVTIDKVNSRAHIRLEEP